MSSVVNFLQVLAIANMNYTVQVRKLSHESVARTISCLFIVSGYDIKELMVRDWATQRRHGTFL